MPRCLRYHAPVWDALIWRFVQNVEPTGCSQAAHLLRNYPPYSAAGPRFAVTHSESLDPTLTPPRFSFAAPSRASQATPRTTPFTWPSTVDAMSALSLHPPAAAAAPVLPPSDRIWTGVCDAPVGVDEADVDAGGDDQDIDLGAGLDLPDTLAGSDEDHPCDSLDEYEYSGAFSDAEGPGPDSSSAAAAAPA